MNNWRFVGAAYTVTWVTVLGYLVHLQRVTRRSKDLLDRAMKASP